MPDAEVLKVAVEILSSLPIGPFTIKLNHRKLLDATLDLAGVPASKFRAVCSSIDKLDKEPWEAVREELVVERALAPAVADRIGELVRRAGEPAALLAALQAEGVFPAHPLAAAALADLALLFKYLGALGALGSITLDLSLARGLDY
jgi:histidyl-tRNA synthetase